MQARVASIFIGKPYGENVGGGIRARSGSGLCPDGGREDGGREKVGHGGASGL